MRRRDFVTPSWVLFPVGIAGCLTHGDPEPEPEIAVLEIANHRRDERYEFILEIEDEEGVVLAETYTLGPAGAGDSERVLEAPVSPGSHTVRVDVDGESATAKTRALTSDDEPCLRLEFYLGAETLHLEHRTYDQCE